VLLFKCQFPGPKGLLTISTDCFNKCNCQFPGPKVFLTISTECFNKCNFSKLK